MQQRTLVGAVAIVGLLVGLVVSAPLARAADPPPHLGGRWTGPYGVMLLRAVTDGYDAEAADGASCTGDQTGQTDAWSLRTSTDSDWRFEGEVQWYRSDCQPTSRAPGRWDVLDANTLRYCWQSPSGGDFRCDVYLRETLGEPGPVSPLAGEPTDADGEPVNLGGEWDHGAGGLAEFGPGPSVWTETWFAWHDPNEHACDPPDDVVTRFVVDETGRQGFGWTRLVDPDTCTVGDRIPVRAEIGSGTSLSLWWDPVGGQRGVRTLGRATAPPPDGDGGSTEQPEAREVRDWFTPPPLHLDERFGTVYRDGQGDPPPLLLFASEVLPLHFEIEQAAADRFGLERIAAALEFWNGVEGSRWAAEVTGPIPDSGMTMDDTDANDDGVNRVALQPCDDQEARIQPVQGWLSGDVGAPLFDRDERHINYTGLDLFLCDRDDIVGLDQVLRGTVIRNAGVHELCNQHSTDYCFSGYQDWMGDVDHHCRYEYGVLSDCTARVPADDDALRYLYPGLPRLAGLNRVETARWGTLYTHPYGTEPATRVVVAPAWHGSALPVAAAALAGASDAAFVLAQSCAAGTNEAADVNRLVGASTIVYVVGAPEGWDCAQIYGNRTNYRTLPDVGAVADELARLVGSDTVLVVRGPMADGNLPDGLTAAAAGGAIGAPLLFADGDRVAVATNDFLDDHPDVTDAVIVGGSAAVPESVADELRGRGLAVARYYGQDRIGTALSVLDIPGAFPAGRTPVLLASASAWPDAATGSALGALRRWPVLLSWPQGLDGRVASVLAERASGGFVVGGKAVVPPELQDAASRQISRPSTPRYGTG